MFFVILDRPRDRALDAGNAARAALAYGSVEGARLAAERIERYAANARQTAISAANARRQVRLDSVPWPSLCSFVDRNLNNGGASAPGYVRSSRTRGCDPVGWSPGVSWCDFVIWVLLLLHCC